MHTAHMQNILLESLLSDAWTVGNYDGPQAIDVVTFDFKGTHVLWVGMGSTGYQMHFV